MRVRKANWHGRKCPVPQNRTVEIDGKLYRASMVGTSAFTSWPGKKFQEYGKLWICQYLADQVE